MTFKFYLRMVATAMMTLFLAVGCSDDNTDDPKPDPTPDPTVDCTFDLKVEGIGSNFATVYANPSDKTVPLHVGVAKKSLVDTFASDTAFQTNDIETLKSEAEELGLTISEYLKKSMVVGDIPTMFSNLESSTDYYAYVYGITEAGEVTTALSKIQFTTLAPQVPLKFEITVSGVTPYGATVAVKPSASGTYYYDVFEKAEMDKFANDAAIIAELEKSADFESGLVTGEKSYTYGPETEALKPKTEYYAYAFEYGNPNLAAPEITKVTFTTKSDDPFTPTYESWLGKWKVKSKSSLVSNSSIEYDIEITQKVAGASYDVKGWGITTDRSNISFMALYTASDLKNNAGEVVFTAGSLLFQNDQTVIPAAENGNYGSFIGYMSYNNASDPTFPAMIVAGNYYPVAGVLVDASEATLTGSTITLETNEQVVMSGADIFVRNGNQFGYWETVTTPAYDFPVGPYTLTKVGEVDPPTPPVGDLTFAISVTNITDTSMHLSVTPSNNTDTYFCTTLNSSWEGASDDTVITQLDAFLKQNGSSLLQSVGVGPISTTVDQLDPGSKYFVVAFGYDATGATTAITWESFTTTGGGGGDEPGDGPALELSAKAGDENGANTDTKGYIVATSPTATAAKYGRWPKNVVDEAGMSIDEIVTQYGADGDAQFIKYLNGGLGLTFNELNPATTYTVIFKVTDAAGKSTVKSVDFTTTGAGGGGEASDAYKAWLGTWTVTSSSSAVSAKPMSLDITIAQDVANTSYKITGWGISKLRTSYPIVGKFHAESGMMYAEQQVVGTRTTDPAGKYRWLGFALSEEDNKTYYNPNIDGIPVLLAALDEGSTTSAAIVGNEFNYEGETFKNTFLYADYFLNGDDRELYNVGYEDGYTTNNKPEFLIAPMTMAKKAAGVAPMAAPMGFDGNFNFSSVMQVSNYALSTKTIGFGVSSLKKSAMVSEVVATSNRSNVLKNLAKLTNPASANDMLTLGSPMRYMVAAADMQMQTGSVKNLLRPIKKSEVTFKLGTVRNE